MKIIVTQPSLLIILASLLSGCGTMQVTKLKTQTADSYTQHAEKNGVSMGVHPMTNLKEIKDTFRVDLRSSGLLPILLVAENHHDSASYIFAKEKVYVLNEDTQATSTSRQAKVASEAGGEAAAVVGAAALSLPLMAVGLKLASDATVVQHNLADKEFYSRTLGPGQKAQGFIYFNYPKGTPLNGTYRVVVEIKDSSTGATTPFDFKVNLTSSQP